MSRGLTLPRTEVLALWAGSLVLLAGVGAGLLPFSWTESLGFASGGVCVWLAVRQHVLTWPIGLLNNVFFFALFLEARLYADMALQAVFFSLGCYGWWWWLARRGRPTRPISRMQRWEWVGVAVAIPLATAVLREVLIVAHGAAPLLDALTTAISLGGQYLLGRKRLENWALWILADLIYVPLYLSRGLQLTAVLYAIFLAMCVVGLRDWWRAFDAERASEPLL